MRPALLLSLLLLSTRTLAAEPEVAIVVSLDGQEHRLTRADLEHLGRVEAEWSAHGHTSKVVGVPLDLVLTQVGFVPGPMGKDVPKTEKRSGWKRVVVASAADGFSAVYSCAELMPSMGPTRALVIWSVDGAPLPKDQGPFRIVVLTDQEPSRSLYSLQRLDIADARLLLSVRK